MTRARFSIDISGTWSPRQADAVIAALEPETRTRDLELVKVDVTCFGGPSRCVLRVDCALHHDQHPIGLVVSSCGPRPVWDRLDYVPVGTAAGWPPSGIVIKPPDPPWWSRLWTRVPAREVRGER